MALKTNLFGAPKTANTAAQSATTTPSAQQTAPATAPQAPAAPVQPLDMHGNLITIGTQVIYNGKLLKVEDVHGATIDLLGGNQFLPVHNMGINAKDVAIVVRNNEPQTAADNETQTAPATAPQTASAGVPTPSAAPATVAQQSPKPQPSPAPSRKASTKADKKDGKKSDYVAPKDAAEGKQRIETAIASKSVTMENDGQSIRFFGNTRSLRDSFRLLGGEWTSNKETNEFFWTIPASSWTDPTTATATKSEAAARREQRAADAQALPSASVAALRARAIAVLGAVFNETFTANMVAKIFADVETAQTATE